MVCDFSDSIWFWENYLDNTYSISMLKNVDITAFVLTLGGLPILRFKC